MQTQNDGLECRKYIVNGKKESKQTNVIIFIVTEIPQNINKANTVYDRNEARKYQVLVCATYQNLLKL